MGVTNWQVARSSLRRSCRLVVAAACSLAMATGASADTFTRCVPDYVLEVSYSSESGWTRAHPVRSIAYRLYDDWSIHIEENGIVQQLHACEASSLFGHFYCGDFAFDFANEPPIFVRIVGDDFEDGAPATTARIETGTCRPVTDCSGSPCRIDVAPSAD